MNNIYKKLSVRLNCNKIQMIVITSIVVILSFGLIITFNQVFFDFNGIKVDIFWSCIFYILTFILIIQLLSITVLGGVKKPAKYIWFILILNMIAMIIAFIPFSIYRLYSPTNGMPTNDIVSWVIKDLYAPSRLVWNSPNLIYTSLFVVITTIIITPILYSILRKSSNNRIRLFLSIILSSLVCYTCVINFLYFNC